jgi:endonuclease/exonuclease/phosphatase (EEP) superfamily protein YafD
MDVVTVTIDLDRYPPRARRPGTILLRLALVLACLVTLGGAAGAGLLAVLRSTRPTAPRLVELVALTPLGLVLSCVAAGSAVLVCLVAGRRGAPLLVVSLALVGLHAWWLAPLYVGDVPEVADGPRLVVMTQNIEYGDPAALVGLVSEAGADVLVVTEADPETMGALDAAGIREYLPHVARHDTGATVVLSRFPITHEEPIIGGGDSRMVTLEVPELGELRVLALHPSPPYQEGQWSANWEAILAFIRDDRHAIGERAVVAGDLNATRDHAPVRDLTAVGFRGAADQVNAGWLPTWPANGWQRRLGAEMPPLVPIDQVLTSPDVIATDVTVAGDVHGDHLTVIATVAMAR